MKRNEITYAGKWMELEIVVLSKKAKLKKPNVTFSLSCKLSA
jgi:hypothetical protein